VPDEEDDCSHAALTTDLAAAALRLQEILSSQPDRPISSLPRWQLAEVRQIQAVIREWSEALREARRG
jgi:hypothetical protein